MLTFVVEVREVNASVSDIADMLLFKTMIDTIYITFIWQVKFAK